MTTAEEAAKLPELLKGYNFAVGDFPDVLNHLTTGVSVDFASGRLTFRGIETVDLQAISNLDAFKQETLQVKFFNAKEEPTAMLIFDGARLESFFEDMDAASSQAVGFTADISFRKYTLARPAPATGEGDE